MLKILIDTSPLGNAHSHRGIGIYTQNLTLALESLPNIVVRRSSVVSDDSFKPDVIHYPYYDLFFSTLPILRRIPTVVTIHDVIPLIFPEHYPTGVKGKLAFLKQNVALKQTRAIITDSEASKFDIESYLNVSSEKIHVIHLAANPVLRAQDDVIINKVKRKYHLPKNYVLYVGDINYNKNIPQLIKMMKFLPENISLVCVGRNFYPHPIPEWQWIETQLALSNVTNRVHFLSELLSENTTDLAAIYSGAKCYVQPSLYEGFGLPVLEALQCRTPVVSTRLSSLPEVGGEHVQYCEPSAESLAAGVDTILSWSKSKHQIVVKEGYKWSQEFTWQKTAEKTAQVYQSVAS